MAELYTPPDVSTGIDHNAEFLLKLDSQQRYDNVFNDFKQPITYKLPDFDQNYDFHAGLPLPQITDKSINMDAVKKGLNSDDAATRDLAWESYDKKFKDDAINRNVGVPNLIPEADWQNKFKNDTFGYQPGLSQAENESYYYNNQYLNKGFFGKSAANIGKFVGRTVGGAVLKLGEGLGYIGAMVVGGAENLVDLVTWKDNHNFMATVADNVVSRYLEGAEMSMKDSSLLSVYKPDDYSKKGFFEKLLTEPTFWNDEVADGTAFLLSAAIPGTVLGKIGEGVSILGKSINGVNKVRNFAQSFLGLETVGDVASVVYNTFSEAAFEGAGVFKNVTTSLKERRAAGDPTAQFTDEQIREKAGNMAALDFRTNLAILSFSTMFENKMMFKPLVQKLSGNVNKTAEYVTKNLLFGSTMNESGEAAVKGLSKNFFGKLVGKLENGGWSKTARLPFYGTKMGTAIAMEGFWEENAQLAAERYASNSIYTDDEGNKIHTEDGFWKQLGKQTIQAVKGHDPENAESIGLGGVLGVFGTTVMDKAFAGRNLETGKSQFWKGERRTQIDEYKEQVDRYNLARSNFLKSNDVYQTKKDDKGNDIIQYDAITKKPLIDKAKVDAKLLALTDYGFRQIKAEQIEDPIFRDMLQKNLFAEYMAAATRAGLDNRLIQKLSALPGKSEQSIQALGFDPSSVKTDVSTLLNNAKELTKAYKDIQKVNAKPQQTYTTINADGKEDIHPMTFDMYNAKEDMRKYHAYLIASRAMSSKDAHIEYNKQILAEQQLVRPSVYAPNVHLYDDVIQNHNALAFEEDALNQAQEMFKGLEYTLLNDHIKERLKSIKVEKAKLRTDLDGFEEAKKDVTEEDGKLISQKYRKFSIAPIEKIDSETGQPIIDEKTGKPQMTIGGQEDFNYEEFLKDTNTAIKRAQMQVDLDFNTTLTGKLQDKQEGLNNYDKYHDYLAKQHMLDVAADEKVAQDNTTTTTAEAKIEEIKNLPDNPWGDVVAKNISTTTLEEDLLAEQEARNSTLNTNQSENKPIQPNEEVDLFNILMENPENSAPVNPTVETTTEPIISEEDKIKATEKLASETVTDTATEISKTITEVDHGNNAIDASNKTPEQIQQELDDALNC